MKNLNRLSLFILCLLSFQVGFSQGDWCGTEEITQEAIADNPALLQLLHKRNLEANNGGEIAASTRSQYTIPVVVHVIHAGGAGNISYEQIQDAIDIMNEDYNRDNPDTANTRSTSQAPFKSVAANVDIEFKLAKRDPQGNCTNGVVRVLAPNLTYNATDACKKTSNGGSDAWDINSYLNIWVVNSIDNDGQGITLGYAYLPYFNSGNDYGILIRNDAMGTIGTSNADGRTLTHEMGHSLGLLHTFQGGFGGGGGNGCHTSDCSQNGDYCCDTPPVTNSTQGCNSSQNSCNAVPTNDDFGFDAYDQIENYMSYDACQNMFSEGQKTRIVNVLTDNQYNANNLWQPSNLVATGVNEPDEICKADFIANKKLVCEGETISFTDNSYHGVTSWNWTFNGGSPASSTNQNPSVTYNSAGVYEVTLTASDGNNTESTTKTQYIEVLPTNGTPTPITEGFENDNSLPLSDWFTKQLPNQTQWEITDNFASSGSQSLKLNNFAEGSEKYELISKTINLSSPGPVLLTFDYAYKSRQASNNEYLRVYLSSDCGNTWNVIDNFQGSSFGSGMVAAPFEPTDEDWNFTSITTIPSSYQVSNFRFKFEFSTDNGNHFYLDNINLFRSSLSVEENNNKNSLSIYPNPAQNNFRINMDVQQAQNFNLNILDMSGRKVMSQSLGTINQGSYNETINISNLSSGNYMVRLVSDKAVQVKKLIIQ